MEVNMEQVIKTLAKEESCILATSLNDLVTTRTISHINDGLTLYFYTSKSSFKVTQMTGNPHVAIAFMTLHLEGIVSELGSIKDEKLRDIKTLYKQKWPDAFQEDDPFKSVDETFYKIEVTKIKQWVQDETAHAPIGYAEKEISR